MYHIYVSPPYDLPMISLSEVSHMYDSGMTHVSLMYHLCITGTCLHKMAKMAIMDLFGNNGKKQQSQPAFFGRRYYRVIFLWCHLFMPDRGNKAIILKLKNQKKMAKFVSNYDVEGTLQSQTCYKAPRKDLCVHTIG